MPGNPSLTILALGDLVGKPGRQALARALPALIEETSAGFVMVNAENASGGLGLKPEEADELLRLPVSVLTSGNHIWKHKDIRGYLDKSDRVLRPANFPAGTPGRGWTVATAADSTPVAVLNLQGLLFMESLDCPFRTADALLVEIQARAKVILVDFHAEATSEKKALGLHLDGRISALVGTHTHVPTADAEVLPGGSGYLTDLGMCGAADSVIGVRSDLAIERFLTHLPTPFQVARDRPQLQGAVIQVDPASGRCLAIERRTWPAD
jgi:metallophosphoesterase (TIGR00282 family)